MPSHLTVTTKGLFLSKSFEERNEVSRNQRAGSGDYAK